MRTFIVVGHKAKTTPEFSLEDIPGTSGRIDILCRCTTAAFVLSHGIRKDVVILLVLCGGLVPKTICLKGSEIMYLNPDERTTAALLKKALELPATPEWSRSTPGIYVRNGGLNELLQQMREIRLLYLREDGTDIRRIDLGNISKEPVFLLGDHLGLISEEEELIKQIEHRVISVGPTSLHADHCIVLINNELDRFGREESA
ncbi:MAG: tRNA (pseudouridine(54)-N(1))-methyltransferase TrmY [Methanotrichaceae archaeon]|nr:tRNA (pseudouridine(54)-N(1))-methyltransferase TrmY [Methanotrichaceae archaeon]